MGILREAGSDDPLNGATVLQHPQYLAQRQRRDELQSQVEALERRIADSQGRREKLLADTESAAQALLAGEPVALQLETEIEVVAGLQRDCQVARRAVQLADERLCELRGRLSREAVEKLRPVHRELVRQAAAALAETVRLDGLLRRFDGRLTVEGIDRGDMPLLHVGIPRGPGVAGEERAEPVFLIAARQHGFIK